MITETKRYRSDLLSSGSLLVSGGGVCRDLVGILRLVSKPVLEKELLPPTMASGDVDIGEVDRLLVETAEEGIDIELDFLPIPARKLSTDAKATGVGFGSVLVDAWMAFGETPCSPGKVQ